MGLWSTLGIGRSALQAAQLAMEVTSHNIANAASEGYARQRVRMSPSPALGAEEGVLVGSGASVSGIQAMVDRQLEERLRAAAGESADLGIRHAYLARLEGMVNELGDDDLSSAMSEFFNAIEDLQPDPSNMALRGALVERGRRLAEAFSRTRSRLDRTWLEVDDRIVTDVGEVNRILENVASLNGQIVEREGTAGRGSANDLRNQRETLLTELARLIDIRTIETPNGAVNVFLGNHMLVQDQRADEFLLSVETDRGVRRSTISLASDGSVPAMSGGELGGLIASRDEVLGGMIEDIDALARALIRGVNQAHSSGQGLLPLRSVSAEYAVSDPGAPLDEAGLPFTPANGRFEVTVVEADTGIGTTTPIDVDLDGVGADSTLEDVAAALDAIDGLSARVDGGNRLVVEADSDHLGFQFTGDTSGLLAALGINTFFSGSDSRSMAVAAPLSADPSRLAASLGGAGNDADNLARMLAVRDAAMEDLDGLTLGEFLETSVTTLATQTAAAEDASAAADGFLGVLTAEREALSGVSLDEEALDLLRFQRSFQAAARVIATADEMLRTLLAL